MRKDTINTLANKKCSVLKTKGKERSMNWNANWEGALRRPLGEE